MPTTHRLKHTQTSRSGKERRTAHQDFSAGLGAARSFAVESKPRGPFGVAALLDEIQKIELSIHIIEEKVFLLKYLT